MSSFQIPGLGQARPNESLPPLPADVAVAAASAEGHEETEEQDVAAEADDTNHKAGSTEAMAVDEPDKTPSLTHALEAAIGGLAAPNPEAPAERILSQPAQPAADSDIIAEAPVTAPAENQTNVTEDAQSGDTEQNGQAEWELDSSPYESSSESSSSDSSSDEDSDNEGYELLGVEETARLLMEAEGGSDDEGDKGNKASTSAQVRTKNEMAEEAIPKPDVTITPEMKIEELGVVEHIVENIMLVKAITSGEYQVLDTGSVLCDTERTVIGAVSETIGKVLQPLYTVRFNSAAEISEMGLEIGTKIFYPVDHASYVFTEPLKGLKGSDASNLHDEEVGDEEMEFSDDEKEAEYKRSLKQKKRDKWKNGGGAGSRGGKASSHPLRQEMQVDGGLNYDDGGDEDGPYKPLARPPGFGSGPVSSETYEPPPRSYSGRRGDFRGRGSRGRGRGGRGGRDHPREGYSMPPQGHQQHPHTQAPPPPPGAQWPANNAGSLPAPSMPSHGAVPALPNFGFQMGGWPQQQQQQQQQHPQHGQVPPPPPPGWPAQAQGQGQGSNNNAPGGSGAFVNPALFAALMSQMQAQNGQHQSPWGGQQQPGQGGGSGQ